MRAPVLFGSLRGYRPAWLRADVVAGLTVWAVLVPESLAYAALAGVPPVVGLWAAPAALVLYAALGSSRHLVVGPMSATAALSAVAVAGLAGGDPARAVALTAALALVTGLVAVAAGLLRMGFLASFISRPVLKGFVIGLALTIIIGQLPKLFGVERADGNAVERLVRLVDDLGGTNPWTLAVGAGSLVLLVTLRRVAPLVPAALAAVVAGVLTSVLLDLPARGVAVVGPVQSGLPPLGLPAVAPADYLALAAAGIGIALVGFAEGLGAARAYASRAGYDVDADRELLGLGAANLGAALSSGMVVNGSLSKTAVNGGAGGRSQVSGLVVAALTLLTLLLLTGLFERLPEATLGAVVIVAVVELVDVGALCRLYGLWTARLGAIYGPAARADFAAAVAALVGVLLLDTLPGLFVGIGVSVLLLLHRASRPHVAVLGRVAGPEPVWVDVARHPDAERAPGVLVVRVESGLFFANADHVRSEVRRLAAGARAVVLDAETVPSVDLTAAEVLGELARDLERAGARLLVARGIGQVRDVLRRAGPGDLPVGVHPTVDSAVAAAAAPPPGAGEEGRPVGELLGALLPLALGVAISPVPVIAAILMLLASRAGGASAGFLLGWVLGIAGVAVVVVVLARAGGLGGPDGGSAVGSWIALGLGALLVVLGVREWRGRPAEGEPAPLPGWMSAIDALTTARAAGLGVLLAAVNPKNLALTVAAGVAVGGAALPLGPTALAIGVFTALAASTVAVPVVAHAVAADRMAKPLDALRRRLVQDNAVIMAVLLTVVGVVLVGRGVAGL